MEQARVHEDAGEIEAALELYEQLAALDAPRTSVLVLQATALLRLWRVDESLEVFERAIALDQEVEPFLWQRGVALHASGRYDDCARQFAGYSSVRPGDAETAIWHYACRALAEDVETARLGLLPADADTRVVMQPLYALLEGRTSKDDVLAVADRGPAPIRSEHLFSAHFYLGLIEQAGGNDRAAREHFKLAASQGTADVLGDVARLYAAAAEEP